MATPAGETRAVLFDLDETIVPVSTRARWQWAWKPNGPLLPERHVTSALRRSIHAWDRRRWRGLVGAEPPVAWRDYRAQLGRTLLAVADRPLPEAEVQAVLDRVLGPAAPMELFPDVPGALGELKRRGVPFLLLSAVPPESAFGLVKRAGLDPGTLLLGGSADPCPPDRKAFRAAGARLGLRPSEILFVGDLYWSDVRAAARAGLRSVLLDRDERAGPASGERMRSLGELGILLDRPRASAAEPTMGESPTSETASRTEPADRPPQ